MRPKDRKLAASLDKKLQAFSATVRAMPGINNATHRAVLIEQLLESIHRVDYIGAIKTRSIAPDRANPSSQLFDPLKAAIIHYRAGNVDEAFWLVFLATHFGRHLDDKWQLVRDIYGALGTTPWTWGKTSGSPAAFTQWLANNLHTLQNDGISRRFGGHRPYESLEESQHNRGTPAAIESYVTWVGANRGHQMLIDEATNQVGSDPKILFSYLYKRTKISSFGRLAKFDYLTMLGKLGFAPIEPGSPYLQGATGPLRGARLLFTGSTTDDSVATKILDKLVIDLGATLNVGMQVMEDSLCNWQKSPGKFFAYRG